MRPRSSSSSAPSTAKPTRRKSTVAPGRGRRHLLPRPQARSSSGSRTAVAAAVAANAGRSGAERGGQPYRARLQIEHATTDNLQRRDAGLPRDALHGHGHLSSLTFEDGYGGLHPVSPKMLQQLLGKSTFNCLRLVRQRVPPVERRRVRGRRGAPRGLCRRSRTFWTPPLRPAGGVLPEPRPRPHGARQLRQRLSGRRARRRARRVPRGRQLLLPRSAKRAKRKRRVQLFYGWSRGAPRRANLRAGRGRGGLRPQSPGGKGRRGQ